MRTWNYTEKRLRRATERAGAATPRATRRRNILSVAFVPPEAALLAARLREAPARS